QRRLSDPRFTADEDHRTRYDPAAEGEVELLQARVPTFRRGAADVAELRRRRDAPAFRQRARAAKAPRRASGARGDARRERFLDERVPFAARVTTALPLRVLRGALGAAIHGLRSGHRAEFATPDGASSSSRSACTACGSGG